MIKTFLIGHLGKDANVKDVNGKTVINFSVAHTESFKNNEGVKIEKTLWVECAHWSDRTAIAQYLKKGTQVFVEGLPSIDTYTNTEGKAVAKLKLRVAQIQLLGSSNKTEQHNEQTTDDAALALVKKDPVNDFVDEKDDLPF